MTSSSRENGVQTEKVSSTWKILTRRQASRSKTKKSTTPLSGRCLCGDLILPLPLSSRIDPFSLSLYIYWIWNEATIYPRSFRRRFAKTVLNLGNCTRNIAASRIIELSQFGGLVQVIRRSQYQFLEAFPIPRRLYNAWDNRTYSLWVVLRSWEKQYHLRPITFILRAILLAASSIECYIPLSGCACYH